MTSLHANASGPDLPAPRMGRSVAFTLVEVLVVVALLGLGAMLLVSGASDIFRSRDPRPDEVFWQAVTSARQLALESSETVTFRYDKEKRLLAWGMTPETMHTVSFPGPLIEFLPATEQGSVLIGGQLAETGGISRVRFFADGGCDAFRAQLTDAAGHRKILVIDPWTCAPMLAATP